MKTIEKKSLSNISGGVNNKETAKQATIGASTAGAGLAGYNAFSLGGPQHHNVSKVAGGAFGAASCAAVTVVSRNPVAGKIAGGFVTGASAALMDNKINTPRPADIRKVSTSEWCQIHADRMH